MKRVRFFLSLIIAVTLSQCLPGLLAARAMSSTVTTQTREATSAKVDSLLRSSGYTNRKTSANTWVIERPAGKKGWVLVAAGDEFVVLGIIVAEKKNMRASADLSFKLLKLNHNLNYVKVGFDNDDDLFARIELRARLIDLPAFKTMFEDVNTSADEAYEVVRPFLINP